MIEKCGEAGGDEHGPSSAETARAPAVADPRRRTARSETKRNVPIRVVVRELAIETP